MTTNINTEEGAAVPTPPQDMSQDSAPQADPVHTEATKSPEILFAERTLGREFASVEEAEKAVKNLNSFVGDQTVSSQRKALEKIASQANMSTNELIEYLATQDISTPQATPDESQVAEPAQVRNVPDMNTQRLVRVEVNSFLKDTPEAQAVRDQLFAKALASGKPVDEVWAKEFAPLIELGKKSGAKKLQQNIEGQPVRATSVASEQSDTTVDFTGINPATNRRWTADEMAKYLTHS